tara:strand:- start:51 stop:725 length:675 start_codon:yes stop_codon:yes gene_type:complete
MKKYFYNFYLILININKYGFTEIIKALFIEIFYLIRIRDFKSWIHDDKFTDSYQDTKNDNNYNAQHTPTPYYFLNFASSFLKKNEIDDFVISDFGCGFGRIGKFFSKKFNCIFYGMEINNEMIEYLKKENREDFYLFALNLKNKHEREKVFDQIKKHKKTIILFISDSFDINTINEIIKYFDDTDHYIIGINIKDSKNLLPGYEKIDNKEFNDKSRHIFLMKKI